MIKLDDNLLVELGLGDLPKDEKTAFLRHMYETLEMRVGTRLAEKMSDDQMREFEQFINSSDEQGAFHWLESNFPNYKDVVAEEFEKLKSEVKPLAPQIAAAAHEQQAGQPGQVLQAASSAQQAGQSDHSQPQAPAGTDHSRQYQPAAQPGSGQAQVFAAQPGYQGQPPYDGSMSTNGYQQPDQYYGQPAQPGSPQHGVSQPGRPQAFGGQPSATPSSPAAATPYQYSQPAHQPTGAPDYPAGHVNRPDQQPGQPASPYGPAYQQQPPMHQQPPVPGPGMQPNLYDQYGQPQQYHPNQQQPLSQSPDNPQGSGIPGHYPGPGGQQSQNGHVGYGDGRDNEQQHGQHSPYSQQ